MERTYDPARRVVKGMGAYLVRMRRQNVGCARAVLLVLVLATARPSQAQGLPEFGPLNPVAASRSGLYFQPFREPETGRWRHEVGLDYASVIEYNRLDRADYIRSEEHTSELQSQSNLVCRLLLEKKKSTPHCRTHSR